MVRCRNTGQLIVDPLLAGKMLILLIKVSVRKPFLGRYHYATVTDVLKTACTAELYSTVTSSKYFCIYMRSHGSNCSLFVKSDFIVQIKLSPSHNKHICGCKYLQSAKNIKQECSNLRVTSITFFFKG